MKLTIIIFDFLIFLLIISKSEEATINYGTLIENVYDEYKTLGIIMATSRIYFSLEKITDLQKLSRKMSARGIGSTIVNFEQLDATVTYHYRQPTRLLAVIFLDEITEVHEFKERIVGMDIDNLVWLVLFTGDNDKDSCEYCRYPPENPFNLKFDTEMLVSCCNANYIAKWLPDKMNYTDTLSRDEEIDKVDEIKSHHKRSLYNQSQFVDIDEPRIVIVQGSESIWKKDNELQGYVGEIITELSRAMHFKISHVIEEPMYGSFDPQTSTWTGAIGTIVQGKADIAASEFDITLQRRSVIDYTTTIEVGKPGFYYQNPHDVLIHWTGFLQVFHPNIWFVIIIFLLITPILLTIIQYTRKNNLLDIISGNYLNIWGIFCQQGTSDSLHGGPLRMIYLTMLILSIIVYASYSAALIRHLTTFTERPPFLSIKDVIEDGTHQLIALKDTSNHHWIETDKDTSTEQLRKLLNPRDSLPTNRKEAFRQVCLGHVVFHDDEADEYLRGHDVSCEILSFKAGGIFHMGLILSMDSKYTKIMNYYLQQFRQNGMLDRMKRKYSVTRYQHEISYLPVTFRDVLPILTIFAVGFSITFIVFCIEKALNYKTKIIIA